MTFLTDQGENQRPVAEMLMHIKDVVVKLQY
jgi:hypothetical protein